MALPLVTEKVTGDVHLVRLHSHPAMHGAVAHALEVPVSGDRLLRQEAVVTVAVVGVGL